VGGALVALVVAEVVQDGLHLRHLELAAAVLLSTTVLSITSIIVRSIIGISMGAARGLAIPP
jgi:hypothetical protein